MKEEPELALENEFYSTAMQVVEKYNLTRVLDEAGFIPVSTILKQMGPDLANKYESLDGIRGSRPRLLVSKDRKVLYTSAYLAKNLMHFEPEEISPDAKLFNERSGILSYVCVSMLTEGKSFGEKGLEDNTPRNATILCTTDCFFCCVMKRDYEIYLRDLTKNHLTRIRDFFFADVFKKAIGKSVIDNLGPDFAKLVLNLKKGDVLFNQNNNNDNVYIVKSGSVTIEKAIYPNESQNDLMIKKNGPKIYYLCSLSEAEIVGEECLFEKNPKEFTARVISESASFYYTSKQTMRSYMSKWRNLVDFLKGIYQTRRDARKQQLEQMQIRDTKPAEPVPVRPKGPTIRTKGARVDTWNMKKAIPTMPITDMAVFDKVYKSELANFVREVVPGRDPHFPMLKDFESSFSQIPIVKSKIAEIESHSYEDFLLRNSDYVDLNKMRYETHNQKRLVKLKLETFQRRSFDRRDHTKTTKDSSLTQTSVDYPKSVDFTVDHKLDQISKESRHFSPVKRRRHDKSMQSILGKSPTHRFKHESRSQRLNDLKSTSSELFGYSFDAGFKSFGNKTLLPDKHKSLFQERLTVLMIGADITKTECVIGKFRDSYY